MSSHRLAHFTTSIASTMRRPRRSPWHALTLGCLLTLAACGPSGALRTIGTGPRTAHERYARSLRDAGLDSTALGREWLAASDSALRSPYRVSLPARELGVYSRAEARAVAYRIALREGERLRITLRADGPPARLYMDLFEVGTDSAQPFEHRVSAREELPPDSAAALLTLDHEALSDASFTLRLQPELLRNGRYELTMRVEPILAFPVDGRGNEAIQSLFGVDRDGGQRSHHGIDIFAPRGTPVLAGTNGVVRSISPNNLGGNVVWLGDSERAQSLYYAHLDRHAVTAGQRVRTGDTLGFVGNTGNARTTAPHLHFGIYTRGGPIDPLRYVRRVAERPPAITGDTAVLGQRAVTTASLTLQGTLTDSVIPARRLARQTPLTVMAASADAYRVQLDDGTSGYVPAKQVRARAER
ncbi:MAG TPA: M23 family metallopeptidase [Gemmatimonadaceae bacterium]|nr:M23 family metallopeptidase [Gemmatimonadaceae bacterium]